MQLQDGIIIADPPSGGDDLANLQAAVDACFGPVTAPHGADYTLNKVLFIPGGKYSISAPLQLKSVQGGKIFGAQRFQTLIYNPNGTGLIRTNGFQYSSIDRLYLHNEGTSGVVLDLDFDGDGLPLQSNSFHDLFIHGGDIGINIANGGYMGSEMSFYDCYILGGKTWGIATQAYNALQNKMVGGNIQGCGIGAYMYAGNISFYDVGFQQNHNWDIQQLNTSGEATIVSGCRSESVNFWLGGNGKICNLIGCSQTSDKPGIFATHSGQLNVNGCYSRFGKIGDGSSRGKISCSNFGRFDWIDKSDLSRTALEIESVGIDFNAHPNTTYIQRQRINANGTFTYNVTKQ